LIQVVFAPLLRLHPPNQVWKIGTQGLFFGLVRRNALSQ